ncbi:helix-turn-helix transcriptional regulator [Shinella daejeonensis]|uniref:transcriptional regulator VisN n=1 Tax=Shinella daejeonensis TaxID=659017 RepID=UPI0020C802E8|nr:helix-turn-helix transcriptional regulator [Shinella daejeonensis]MCP8896790.1 helix-turn-helix transcriptional regulator [Shinella daejeonensis]
METIRSGDATRTAYGFPAARDVGGSERERLVRWLGRCADKSDIPAGLKALTDYVSASYYLLLRHDIAAETGLESVLASDWPFNLVRGISTMVATSQSRMSDVEKCLGVLKPHFFQLPDSMVRPRGIGREYCAVSFQVGRARLSLMLLFPEHFILSQSKLRDVGLLAGYFASRCCRSVIERHDRDRELTDREVECLYWIAEGKTSDEVALILGISRNTINNYITGVMRKTATRTRSEAIAWAVRNGLV